MLVLFIMAIFETKKLRVVWCACCVQCSVTLVAKKARLCTQITDEVHCRIRSFCCSLNCSGYFFYEGQTKLADSVRSAYSSDNTKAWFGLIWDILLFCESLIRLFNRISVDKTVCNRILMRDIIIIFTERTLCVCVCVCLCEIYRQKHLSWIIWWGPRFKCWFCNCLSWLDFRNLIFIISRQVPHRNSRCCMPN
jgi:hypothetical protein